MLVLFISLQGWQMLKQNMLEALQKHLGVIDTQSLEILDTQQKSAKIDKFSREIKGINESIGALQTLQIACQKLLKLIPTLGQDSNTEPQMQEVVQKAQFLGQALFGGSLVISLESESLEVQVANPLELLETQGAGYLSAYLHDRLEIIKQALGKIQESVSQKQVFSKPPTLNTPSFSKEALLGLMKTS